MAKKINYTPVSIFAACCGRLASNVAMCNPVTAPYAAVIGTTVSAVVGGLELGNEDNNIKESLDEAIDNAWGQIDTAYRLTFSSEDCLLELKREIMGTLYFGVYVRSKR